MPGVSPDEALTFTVTVCIWPLWTLGVGNTCYPFQRRRQVVHPPEKVALEWSRDTVVAWVTSPGDRLSLRFSGLALVLLQMTHRPHPSVLGGTPATRLMILDRRMVTHNPTSCAWPDHPLTLSLGDFLGKVGVNTQSSRHSCCAKTQSLATHQVLWAFGVSSGGRRQLGSAHMWAHVRTDTHTDTHALWVLFLWRTIDTGLLFSSLCLSFLTYQARMMIILII